MSSNIKDKMFTDNQEEEKYYYDNPLSEENFKRIIREDKDHFIIKTLLKELLNFDTIDVVEAEPDYVAYGKNDKNETWCYYIIVGNACLTLLGIQIIVKEKINQ